MAAPASAAAAAPAMAAEEAAAKPVLPRKLTPFMIFCGETRADVLRESPDATDEDVGRALAQRWGALSADERKAFELKSKREKVPPAKRTATPESPAASSESGKKKRKRGKDPNLPKGPLSPFMYFCAHMRPLLRKENPGIAFKELGTRCGERWRELPPDEREPYERMAKEDRARHTREMADYMATQG